MNANLLKGFIGTYTNGQSKGIYNFKFNLKTNKFENYNLAFETEKPSYLTISKNHLYSIVKNNENSGVAAFDITDDLKLNPLNRCIENGNPPCHISVSKDNKYLFSANYHDNKIIIYSLNEDGSIGGNNITFNHNGEIPHIHYVSLDPKDEYLCAVDLGIDKIKIYQKNKYGFIKREDLTVNFRKESGPRHLIFHPNKKFAYVITEYSSEVAAFNYNEGKFSLINVLSTLPIKYTGVKAGAAIKIHPNGKCLYTSNRGHNSITTFLIDSNTGNLSLISNQSTLGNGPRDFDISDNGKILIVANQDSSSLIAYNLDEKTGFIKGIADSIKIPNPTCVHFF